MSTTETMRSATAATTDYIEKNLPSEISGAFADEQRELRERGIPAGVAAVGTAMPDGDLLDIDGKPTTLARARSGSAAVIIFYRGVWCPFCNAALQVYQDELVPALADKNVHLIAISPQKPDRSIEMRDKHKLAFTVLSDPGNRLSGKLGIVTAVSEAARGAQAQIGLDVSAINADGTFDLPTPTVLIVDASGTIRWIDVQPDYSKRTEPAAIVDALSVTV